MPSRPLRAAFRLPTTRYTKAPPGGRLFAFALVALGLGLLAISSAPMLVGAQTAGAQPFAPRDPGVRNGAPGAGGPVNGLSPNQLAFFNAGRADFNEVDSVSGTVPGEAGVGLGPRFNMNSCGGCHAQPAAGGSSPLVNPQVAAATDAGAGNQIPFFVTNNGPVREARFIKNPDGSADGGVHDLFTIAGRSDAPRGCNASVLPQPNFSAEAAAGNLVYRIPTPAFGAGLVEALSEDTLVDNLNANSSMKSGLGISGHLNREGNTGTITRFGWKGQNKSGIMFSGEAYLVEQGVSNEVFPNERGEPTDRNEGQRVEPPAACLANATPEDATNFGQSDATAAMSDVQGFALFMQMLAPPIPVSLSNGAVNGSNRFNQIGCGMCHTPTLTTGKSNIAALSNQTIHPFSDFAVHNMGSGLADFVSQGGSTGTEFRTAPLWGIGQRIFFLHDGRTSDLMRAIQEHASSGSEANAVINNFNALSGSSQQDILNFLRSL